MQRDKLMGLMGALFCVFKVIVIVIFILYCVSLMIGTYLTRLWDWMWGSRRITWWGGDK